MTTQKDKNKIIIKIAKREDLFDVNLCAKEFIDFIDNFNKKFLDEKYFILTAYYENVLAGLLIAEDKTQKIDRLEKIVPNIRIHLLFVNPLYRKKNIGKKLVNTFLMIKIKQGYATVYIELPVNYKKGITFFLNNLFLNKSFNLLDKKNNKVFLEMNLWNDYGIRNCQIIKLDSFGIYK